MSKKTLLKSSPPQKICIRSKDMFFCISFHDERITGIERLVGENILLNVRQSGHSL